MHKSIGPMSIGKYSGDLFVFMYRIETDDIGRSDCTCSDILQPPTGYLFVWHIDAESILDGGRRRGAWMHTQLHSSISNKSKWLLFKVKFAFDSAMFDAIVYSVHKSLRYGCSLLAHMMTCHMPCVFVHIRCRGYVSTICVCGARSGACMEFLLRFRF